MQRGLIDGAGYERIAAVMQCDGQAAKPVCPLTAQLTFDPDLIDYGLISGQFLD